MTTLNATVIHASIRAGGCVQPDVDACKPAGPSTTMEGGKAVFENANYRITCGDDNEVKIHNKNTGETYRAWGDPHMEIDGKHAFDFWGTTTFCLDDGTKVTIETTPWKNDPSMTLSSKVTITDGDYGVHITGVDTNTTGDLQIDEGKGWGRVVDAFVDDGNVLHENTCGKGFVAVDDFGRIRKVDQNYINQTDLQKGGALQEQFKDAFRLLSGLLSISFVGVFLGALGQALSPNGGSDRGRVPDMRPLPMPKPREDVMWAGGTPPWVFDETGRGRDGRPPVNFELTIARVSIA